MANITDVENLIKEQLHVNEIDPSATLSTYGLDSLDVVEFLLSLEEKFSISFESEETKDVKTVGDLLKLVEKKLK